MKLRKLALCALAAATAILSSCVEKINWDDMDAELELTPAQVSFEIAGGEQTVHLYTTRSWKAKDVPSWVIITPSEGEPVKDGIDISIKVSDNKGYNRKGSIEISGGIVSETLTITQNGPDGEDDGKISVADFIKKADTATEYVLVGTISNIADSSYYGFDLTDATGTVAIAFPTNFKDYVNNLADGGTVTVKGVYAFYEQKGTHQMQNGEIVDYVAPKPIDPTEIKQITVKEFIDKADATTNYRLVGKVENFNSQYTSFDLNDGTGKIYVYSVSAASKTEFGSKIANGGTVTLYGKYYFYEKDKKTEIKDAVIEKFEAGSVESISAEGQVVAISAKSFVVSTGNVYQYVFTDAEPGVKLGDQVSVTGEKSTYNGVDQISKPSVTVKSNGTVTYPTATVLDASGIDKYNTALGYVRFTGNLVKSGNYYNIDIAGASRKGSIVYAASDYSSFNGKTVDITGFFVGISGSIYFNVVVTDIQVSDSQQVSTLKHPVISALKWTLGNKANDNTSTGSNKQYGTFNGTAVDNLLKLGTASVGGDAKITVPAGKTKVGFYCVGFGKDQTDGKTPYKVTCAIGSTTKEITVERYIASGNAPYTLTLDDAKDYYTVEFPALAADTEMTVTAAGRMIFVGFTAE